MNFTSSARARRSTESTASNTTTNTSGTRRRLSRNNRDNTFTSSINTTTNNREMVDASPQQGRPNPTHAHSHSRSSLFGFSFAKNRANSAQSSMLSTVHEGSGSGNGNADEFGLSRPPAQQPQQPQSGPSSSSNMPQTMPERPGSRPTPVDQQPQPQSQGPPQAQLQSQLPAQRQLHPEIRSIVNLSTAHAHKVYFSGPLVKHVERHTDGKIVGKEEPWREVWAQLGGTTLSVWDMKEIEEASKRGAEVPPTYLNITDASIHVLGAVTMPGPNGTPVKYMNVITLTTAGLNLLLFSCPSPQALVAWTAALRLSAYEKSRLEELYTAHLLRMSLSENDVWKDPRSPLVNGRLEGWVKIRINGQTDWKRLWMCVQAGQPDAPADGSVARKNRMSTLFGRTSHEHNSSITSIPSPNDRGGAGGNNSLFDPRLPHIALFPSPKTKDRKKAVLTLINVTQVFAVYPERPELISRSTLVKMEGFIGDEELAGEWRSREGWVLMMPEAEPGKLGSLEMLKWLVGLHDAFSLYGRPGGYTWNPRDPQSLMFAYPVGPHKDNLFLDRELAESVDPREDRGSVVRQRFKEILIERMYGQDVGQRMSMGFSPLATTTGNGSAAPPPTNMPPSLPPIQTVAERRSEESQDSQHTPQNGPGGAGTAAGTGVGGGRGGGGTFQLPPFSFDTNTTASNMAPVRDTSSLSPITERTDSHSLSRRSTQDQSHLSPSASVSMRAAPRQSTIQEESPDLSILGSRRVESPPLNVPAFDDVSNDHQQLQQQRTGTTSPPHRPAQLAPRFSQDSGAGGRGGGMGATSISISASGSGSVSVSASGSGSAPGAGGGVTSPARGARSPPLSPDSSTSRYSQPEGSIYSSPNTNINTNTNIRMASPEQGQSGVVSTSTSTVQSPASERDAPSPSSFGMQQYQHQSPMSSLPPRMQQQQHQLQQQGEQQVPPTPASHMSHATFMSSPFSINERNKEQPPPPPEKNTRQIQQQGQRWEPQYKSRVLESEYVFDEPGALYLMQQHRQAEAAQQGPQPRRSEDQDDSDEDERSENSEHSALTNPMSLKSPLRAQPPRATPLRATPSPSSSSRVPLSPVPRRHGPGGFEVVSGAVGTAALATVSSPRSVRSGSLPDAGSFTGCGAGSGGVAVENGGPRGLGRRPSGARAQQRVGGKRFVPSDSPSSLPLELDEHEQQNEQRQRSVQSPPPPSTSPQSLQQRPQQTYRQPKEMSLPDDATVDVLAALSFLDQQDAPDASKSAPTRNMSQSSQQEEQELKDSSGGSSAPAPPTIFEPEDRAPSPPSQQSGKSQTYRSSFAPSKQAAERKARSAAQQAAHEEVLHKPGRPNGKQRAKPKQREGGWESSEDDEEEEEEDDDDDVGTDEEPRTVSRGGSAAPSIAVPVGHNPMVQQQMRGLSPSNSASDDFRDQHGQQRSVRTLPQIPQRGRSPGGSDHRYDNYEGPRETSMGRPRESSMGRPQSQFPQHQGYPPQFQQQYQQPPGAARQNIWSSVLDAKTDTGMPPPNNNSNNRDTFVQIEAPAETMTKAFTPQGLLSAGMQDKEERSAKRQEELARETGASLINVPNKPPPPQVGLLGAITAHERERKREGGMGATLTEREREKRLAEERQRRLDELQRQQLEQQQQFAAQFGGMGMYGGGLSPQMTGMNPMMGGFGGYPQMMGPQSMYFNPMFPMMNPQHMFAAQQAAQAYQQAMMAMSAAGSQVGGDRGNANGGGDRTSQAMGPMGTSSPGPMMAVPMGYDPRMSMMGMGGLTPMMPMGGMSPMASPMGMQMTGGSGMGGMGTPSGMDPRFSMAGVSGNFDGPGGGLAAPTPSGSGQQSQRVSSYNGSPRGSPAPAPGASNRAGNGNAEENTSKAER